MVPADDGWEGLLDPGEEVLWQGQPEPGVRFAWSKPTKPLFFAVFTAVSLFMIFAIAGEGGFSWVLMLPFVGAGVYNLVFVHYWDDYVRRNTYYTITSKRALIATEIRGRRKLDSYPLLPDSTLIFEESGGLSDIFFAETLRTQHADRRDGIARTRTGVRRIGFRGLRDGRKVYEILRQVLAKQEAGA